MKQNVTEVKMKNREGIAVAGCIIVDNIHDIETFPESGELTEIIRTRKAAGGCVPNVAVDLKRISPQMQISAIGRIGDDENGKYVAGILHKEGVDTSRLRASVNESTGFTPISRMIAETLFICRFLTRNVPPITGTSFVLYM